MPKTDVQPAPYIPFKTFLTATEILEQGLPDIMDKSVWPTFSFSVQGHTFSAFKFLGLIDDDGNVQEDLRRLVSEKEGRKAVVGEIIRKRYPKVVELGEKNASTQQLQVGIKEAGASNAVLVKAVRFFLQAAEYAELPVSPLWKTGKKTTSSKRALRAKPRNKKQQPPKDTESHEPEGQGITVTLPESGATVRLTASVDVIKLVGKERDFLFDLIDKMHSFNGSAGSKGGEATE